MNRSLLAWLALLSATPIMAQTHMGPRIGLGLASITAIGGGGSGQLKPGPLAGWSFDMSLGKRTALLVEPMYIAKGSLSNYPTIDKTERIDLHVVEVPLLLKLWMSKEPGGMFLDAGLAPGYLFKGTVKTWQNGNEVGSRSYETGTTSKLRISGAFGIGFQKRWFAVEFRAQSTFNPFATVAQPQFFVIGTHLTFYIPHKPKEKAEEPELPEDDPESPDYFQK